MCICTQQWRYAHRGPSTLKEVHLWLGVPGVLRAHHEDVVMASGILEEVTFDHRAQWNNGERILGEGK